MQALLKFAVVIVWMAQGAVAQDRVRIDRMQSAFESWLTEHDTQGVAAVAFDGAPVAILDGGLKPDTPAELASVSKSITSLCVDSLIEDAANERYEETCRQRVLVPAGATGAASPRSGANLNWGGWQMMPTDYAALHSYRFSTQTDMGRDPFAYPHVEVAEGVYYGLGTFFRKSRDGHNFWHHGALCLPGRLNIGSFAMTWQSEWTLFVSYNTCVDWNAMINLDIALGQAAYGALE